MISILFLTDKVDVNLRLW